MICIDESMYVDLVLYVVYYIFFIYIPVKELVFSLLVETHNKHFINF